MVDMRKISLDRDKMVSGIFILLHRSMLAEYGCICAIKADVDKLDDPVWSNPSDYNLRKNTEVFLKRSAL